MHALQDQLSLRPTSRADGSGVPEPAAGPDGLEFFERLRTWMAAFPPAAPDRDYQRRFEPLGLLDPDCPYRDAPADLADALIRGLAAGQEKLETFTRSGTAAKVNGWMTGLHMFDYNLDFFGPGTINEPRWKIGRPGDRLPRAGAVRPGRAVG